MTQLSGQFRAFVAIMLAALASTWSGAFLEVKSPSQRQRSIKVIRADDGKLKMRAKRQTYTRPVPGAALTCAKAELHSKGFFLLLAMGCLCSSVLSALVTAAPCSWKLYNAFIFFGVAMENFRKAGAHILTRYSLTAHCWVPLLGLEAPTMFGWPVTDATVDHLLEALLTLTCCVQTWRMLRRDEGELVKALEDLEGNAVNHVNSWLETGEMSAAALLGCELLTPVGCMLILLLVRTNPILGSAAISACFLFLCLVAGWNRNFQPGRVHILPYMIWLDCLANLAEFLIMWAYTAGWVV